MTSEQPPRRESRSAIPHQSSLFAGASEPASAGRASAAPPLTAPDGATGTSALSPASATIPFPSSIAPMLAAGRQYLTADLRAATGLSRTAMDFYLRTGLIRPSTRTESGYLLFDDAELAVLREVIAWRTRGISLKDIRLRLGRTGPVERQ